MKIFSLVPFSAVRPFAPLLLVLASGVVLAKIPAPVLDDAAKAKAAEAAAKTAWSGKVEGYLLCKYQDKAAGNYVKTVKAAGKEPKAATATPPCADPGPFVYAPAAPGIVPGAAPAAAAAPAPAAASAKKS